MLIDGGPTRDVSILGFGNSDLDDAARAEALLQGREAHPDPNPQFGLYFRSDSYSFAHRGVPVMYTQAGIDSAARGPVWGKAQIEDYFARRFRQPSDQYSADWDVGGAVTDLTLDYRLGIAYRQQPAFSALVSEQRVSRLAPRSRNAVCGGLGRTPSAYRPASSSWCGRSCRTYCKDPSLARRKTALLGPGSKVSACESWLAPRFGLRAVRARRS